jgi:hypothetical protein
MTQETLGNAVIYRDRSTPIDVVEVVDLKLRWWDLVCLNTRERNQFPSVLDRPLRHLSALMTPASTVAPVLEIT